MANLANAGFSFIFWIFAAHFYTQTEVGQATAAIAAVGLVSGFGVLGFNNSIIRFLPKARDKNKLINSALTVVAITALLSGIVFLLLLPHLSSSLLFIRHKAWYTVGFLVFVVSMAINTVLDNTFTAFRSTQYTLFKNILVNVLEIIFVIAFLRLAGFGIFAAYSLSFFLVVLTGFGMLIRRFAYRPSFAINRDILQRMAKFSLANYVVSYLNSLPGLALPIIITNLLGAKLNAIYYIAYSVASMLFAIPLGIGNSLFAEGSNDETTLRNNIKRAAFINALMMIPAIILVILLAPFILFFFGKHYSDQGVTILRILALSGIFLAVSYPCGSILNILHKLKSLIAVNFFGVVALIGLVYIFIHEGHGIAGAAWGWLIGWAVYAAAYVLAVWRALSSTSSTSS